MSAATLEDQPARKQDPETLVLRGRPRPIVRFRRGLIISVAGGVALALVLLSWFALEPRTFRTVAAESTGDGPVRSATPEALAGAPRSYSEVPRLGPPLPGDLGRPILEHERRIEKEGQQRSGSLGATPSSAMEERDRAAERRAAALMSPVLVALHGDDAYADTQAPAAGTSMPVVQTSPPAMQNETAISVPGELGQQHDLEFTQTSRGTINPDRVHAPSSPFTLVAGTVIPASLLTGVNSNLPGIVIAQVTENVSDSATATTILVPQGSRLIGRYDSLVAFGQRRALVIWDRIIFPDASSVELDKIPATDVSGYSGLRDSVDAHGLQLIKGIALSTLLGVGAELAVQNSGGDLLRAIRESAQQSSANAGAQITGRMLGLQPTITIRPGWPVRAILSKDLVLRPWKG